MTDITVPELGESIIEGTLTSWLLTEGSSFNAGDNLAEIETEKITIEIPAQSAGQLTKILVKEGSNVKVGEVIAQFTNIDSKTSIQKNPENIEINTPIIEKSTPASCSNLAVALETFLFLSSNDSMASANRFPILDSFP